VETPIKRTWSVRPSLVGSRKEKKKTELEQGVLFVVKRVKVMSLQLAVFFFRPPPSPRQRLSQTHTRTLNSRAPIHRHNPLPFSTPTVLFSPAPQNWRVFLHPVKVRNEPHPTPPREAPTYHPPLKPLSTHTTYTHLRFVHTRSTVTIAVAGQDHDRLLCARTRRGGGSAPSAPGRATATKNVPNHLTDLLDDLPVPDARRLLAAARAAARGVAGGAVDVEGDCV
jgi:hypothetical protein